mmetsp:Transcript_13904/g.37363  ORF Transcript_13904/g.37363 Transcript_13904/m.37363 type:complete len:106 (-) Transcript_13904:486-803(-)
MAGESDPGLGNAEALHDDAKRSAQLPRTERQLAPLPSLFERAAQSAQLSLPSRRRHHSRWRLSAQSLRLLEAAFQRNNFPSVSEKDRLALDLNVRCVHVCAGRGV